MKRNRIVWPRSALAAAPALAADKADFSTCDGLVHPGKQADGLRGVSGSSPFSFLPNSQRGIVAACTRALASPRLLPTQSLRRAHLLRARGAAHLRAGDTAEALKDFDQAEASLGASASDPFMKRSMGVSLMLLRGLARAQSGDVAGAVPLARTAAAARPYSLQVQQAAAMIVQAARPAGDRSPSPWDAAIRLEPDAAATALIKEAEVGNFAGVVALRPDVPTTWPTEPMPPYAFMARTPAAQHLLAAVVVSLHTAYARAATDDAAGARRDLADVRAHVAEALKPAPPKPVDPKKPVKVAIVPEADPMSGAIEKFIDVRARQIEARIAVTERRPSDAIAALVAAPMPRSAATVRLITALKTVVPTNNAGVVPDVASFQANLTAERRGVLADAVPLTLIAPETPRAVVDYSRARPNILGALVGGALSMGMTLLGGIDRTDGFRSTANPDGTIKVEFIGNTPSATLVQEMTLLRAAEVVRAAGKPAFVIVERKEYQRRLVQTQHGVEINSTPTGFKSELTIRPVAAGAEPRRALDAVAIIDALGPLYYEEKKAS